MRTVRSICALTDPFCEHSLGVKYPDSLSSKTLAYQLVGRTTVATGTGGAGALLFVPGYNTFFAVGDATTTPGVVTYGAASSLLTSAIVPATYRIVNFGIEIRNLVAPLNSSGMIRIRGYSQKTGTTLTATSTSNYGCDWHEDIPMSGFRYCAVVGKKLDVTSSFMVAPATTHPTGNVTNWASPGWGAFQVAVEGAPVSVSALDIVVTVNYELAFDDSSDLNLLTTPSPAINLPLQQAASVVSKAAGNVFLESVKSASSSFARAAVKAISGYFGGPAASSAVALVVD